MGLPNRRILLSLAVGAISAMAIATIVPGQVVAVRADEMPTGFDTGRLVKFNDREYTMDYEDWVATDPLSSVRVKKIEAGRVSYVTITTTATGTYSSDALTSKHVLYPGIEVNQVHPRHKNWFSSWSDGGWVSFSSYGGNSYVSVPGRGGY